jgi:hypothetical protein
MNEFVSLEQHIHQTNLDQQKIENTQMSQHAQNGVFGDLLQHGQAVNVVSAKANAQKQNN